MLYPIYSGCQTCERTSRGHTRERPQRISPPSCCRACLDFSREKDSAVPFPRRPRSRILCTHEFIVTCWACFLFCFFVKKNPSSGPSINHRSSICIRSDSHTQSPDNCLRPFLFMFLSKCRFSRVFSVPFSLCMESTSYVFPSGWCRSPRWFNW